MSNLEDMRDAPMVRDDAEHLPDDSTHGAWKDRILGREDSLVNDSALVKKASNPAPWREIRLAGYELIMAELGLKKMQHFNGARGADGSQGKCMNGWYTTYEDSDQKFWLVYREPAY